MEREMEGWKNEESSKQDVRTERDMWELTQPVFTFTEWHDHKAYHHSFIFCQSNTVIFTSPQESF